MHFIQFWIVHTVLLLPESVRLKSQLWTNMAYLCNEGSQNCKSMLLHSFGLWCLWKQKTEVKDFVHQWDVTVILLQLILHYTFNREKHLTLFTSYITNLDHNEYNLIILPEQCQGCSHPSRLSLAVYPGIDKMSTSKSWAVHRHPKQCNNPISVVLQCNLVSGWRLKKQKSALHWGLIHSGRTLHFLLMYS